MKNTILFQNKRVLFVLLFTLAGMTSGFAQEFTVDNLKYSIVDNGSGVAVIGHVDGQNAKGNLIIPNEVSWKRKKYTVTKIQKLAFYDCTGLTSISIPNSVTCIGRAAFYNCTGLTSIFIPNAMTSIGRNAFQDCTGLTSIALPNSITSIDTSVFRGCTRLTSLSIPNSVTRIETAAFAGCLGLTSISIPNSVTSIGDIAFYGCTGLTSITIPNSVTSLGVGTFYNCTGLTSVSLPNSIISTGNTTFGGCTSLTSITLPISITSIDSSAFLNCTGLTSISIPSSVTSIGYGAFDGCTGLTSISIPNSVTSIGDGAFHDCIGLTSITIPNSITSISDYAFQGCTGLSSISIPNSVSSIGKSAFKGCTGLTSISLPQSITSIGDYAFQNCTALTSVSLPNLPISIGMDVFKGCTKLAINDLQLQSHHKYNGDFEMIGFGFDGSETVTGKAQYDYCDAPDGTRIFDGRFMFCNDFARLQNWSAYKPNMVAEDISFEDIEKIFGTRINYLALGRFSQDKQVGKWIWIYYTYGVTYPRIYVCVINFNDKGVPEGDFEIYVLYRSVEAAITFYNAPEKYKVKYLSGTIEDGVIVFIDSKGCDYYSAENYIYKVSGHYNKEGYPIGKWSFSGTEYTDFGKYIFVEFDDKGNCIKNYRIDQTTGDHVGLSYNMVRQPIKTAWGAINCISNRRFRSTPHVKWRQNNICKYGCND